MSRRPAAHLAPLALALTACGGGGGASNVPVVPPGPFTAGVAYLADGDVDDHVELYVAALDGTAYRKISAPLSPTADVILFAWSPDRARIAYSVDEDGSGQPDALLVVDLAGGAPVRVSHVVSAATRIEAYAWAADSQRLGYQVVDDATVSGEVWTTSVQGVSPTRVSGPPVPGRLVEAFAWSPASSRLAYSMVDVSAPGAFHLFLVDPDGTDTLDLGPAPSSAWSPNGAYLAYDRVTDALTGAHAIVRIDPAGASPTPVSGPLPSTAGFASLVWSPDSSHLAWRAYGPAAVSGDVTMWSPVTGPLPLTHLDPALQPPRWSPDSLHLAFLEYRQDPVAFPFTQQEVRVADTLGVVTPITDGSGVYFPFAFDWIGSGRLGIVGSSVSPGGFVYTANPAGGEVVPVVSGTQFFGSPDGAAVAVPSEVAQGVAEVWVSPSDTAYGAHRISVPLYPPLFTGPRVAWTPDSQSVVYLACPTGIDVMELFASTRDGEVHARLSGPLVEGGQVTFFSMR